MVYSKKCAKSNCDCFNEIIIMINYDKNENDNENRSHRYVINGPRLDIDTNTVNRKSVSV